MAHIKVLKKLAFLLLIFKLVESATLNGAINSDDDEIAPDPEMEKYLREAIENFREQMKEGIPAINMPVLDPLELKNLDINIRENLAEMSLKVKQISIEDLSTFNLQHILANLETFAMKLKLSIPSARAKGNYTVNGKLLKIFPVYGNGSLSINLTKAEISGIGKLVIENDTLKMNKLNLDLSWESMTVFLENFLGGGRFSNVLQNLLPNIGKKIFDDSKGKILENINTALKNSLNNELQKPEVKEIIAGLIPKLMKDTKSSISFIRKG